MKTGRALGFVAAIAVGSLWLGGCSDNNCIECVDNEPPAVPAGVFSVTGDGRVTLYWNDVYQDDLAGYAVYRDDDADGFFDHLTDLAWDENYDLATNLHFYVDEDVINGHDYEYAVASFDAAGNESELSFETVVDTPRPEGFNVELFDIAVVPAYSGFDFSAHARVDGRLSFADIYVHAVDGVLHVRANRDDVLLQDYGSVMDDAGFVNLDVLSWAPLYGWSETGDVELILGHAYVVLIGASELDRHYAKFAVTACAASSVMIDWAYQMVPDLRELKAAPSTTVEGEQATAQVIRF